MIVRLTILLAYYLFIVIGHAEAQKASSYQDDTARVMKLIETAQRYRFFNPDSSLPLAQKAVELSRLINFKKGEILAYQTLAEYHRVSGNFPESLENLFKALRLSSEIGDTTLIAEVHAFIGITYLNLKEYQTALHYLFQAYSQKERLQIPMASFIMTNTGIVYQEMNMLDSALTYQKMAWSVVKTSHMAPGKAFVLREMGNVYSMIGLPDSAFYYYRYALAVTTDVLNIGRTYSRMAILFYKLGKSDSAIYYANNALLYGRRSSQKPIMLEASKTLANYYEDKNKLDSALKYQQLTMSIHDSLFGSEQFRKLQLLAIDEQKRVYQAEQKQQEIEQKQKDYQSNLRFYGAMAALAVFILFGIVLYRNNKRQKITNILLQRQKKETEDTLSNLRATQVQLIQSEKMASLGELTAGIAHEIQNPLNFVNNFSEVSKELIIEMKDELAVGNLQLANEIASDVEQNLDKIQHHGKRADAIVKGMLAHSKSGTGKKELTNLNALTEEYLRLAFAGMLAKDKSFSATYKFEPDPNLPKMEVVPQDIGRVLLNLFNNALYAVQERSNNAEPGYTPEILVSTGIEGNRVKLAVKDNGGGIPEKIKEKIFQPFFTTRPTGQGTGLGLSLSYDIVKAHGGEIKVSTKESEGTEFTIQLPIS